MSSLNKIFVHLKSDKIGMTGLIVIFIYLLIAIGVWLNLWGSNWQEITDQLHQPSSGKHWFGTNAIGQDIASRAITSTRTAFEVGIIVSIASVALGVLLGALAGFFSNSWVERIILWAMVTIDSIPFYLFVAAMAYALSNASFAMHIAMVLAFWTTTTRLIRAEFIKLKQQPFIEANYALGLNSSTIIFHHLLPNTSHLILIQLSLIFVSAIKTEVILSFLGIGIQEGISWGLMISEAASEIQAGVFNNLIVASTFLFVLVMALNLFSDAVQDALDPYHSYSTTQ